MFRKLMLSAVLGIGTLTGLTMTPATADARPPVRCARHGYHVRNVCYTHYRVSFQECGVWKVYGTYGNREGARCAARDLRCRGFAVRIGGC
jgi:hypothetical protein